MSESPTIKQADAVGGDKALITLSDGRVFVLTLEQIMSIHPQELSGDEDDDDSN